MVALPLGSIASAGSVSATWTAAAAAGAEGAGWSDTINGGAKRTFRDGAVGR